MPKIRILIVDDSVVMRRLITEVLATEERIEVVGTAPNGRIALQKLTQVNPDLVTMDVEMPELDGLQTLRELRRTHARLPVIMLSTLTQRGASATLDALAAGASDYVTKPIEVASLQESVATLREELLPKILVHFRPLVPELPVQMPTRSSGPFVLSSRPVDLVCIGSSTGGPVALEQLFRGLVAPLPVPLAIVQHMPPMFTQMLAQRLDALGVPLRCVEATQGQLLKPGHAYLAPGGQHLSLSREPGGGLTARVHSSPPENSCRPSVDVLFRSAAQTGVQVLAVVLTGMGQDGLRGCEHVREREGQVLAQDQASSVVWGMPGAVVQAGLAQAVLPLGEIATEIHRRVQLLRRSKN